jgi:hypothetical protein
MNIRAAKAGLRIQEIPSHERPRVHGESNLRVFSDGWRILKVIAAEVFAGSQRRSRRRAALPAREPAQAVSAAMPSPGAAPDVNQEAT